MASLQKAVGLQRLAEMVPKTIIMTTLPSRELLNPPQVEAETPIIPNYAKRPQKSFNLHIGATLTIPTSTTQPLHLHRTSPQTTQQRQASLADPFDGLPLRNFAERLGEAIFPVLQAAQEHQREALRQEKLAAQQALSPISTAATTTTPAAVPTPQLPLLPTFLPFTRWAANSEAFKATLIVEDDPSKRKKPRLSWYHPDDTMIPRDWWKMGLLADLKYYAPFISPSPSPSS